MAPIQVMTENSLRTFDDLTGVYMDGLIQLLQKSHTFIDLFDRLNVEHSIKTGERH